MTRPVARSPGRARPTAPTKWRPPRSANPLGIAGALHRCARQVLASDSFFASPTYAQWRWIWFDIWSDQKGTDLSNLDDPELRALALEEW